MSSAKSKSPRLSMRVHVTPLLMFMVALFINQSIQAEKRRGGSTQPWFTPVQILCQIFSTDNSFTIITVKFCNDGHKLVWNPIITTSRRFKCVFLKWLIPLDVVAWRLSLILWALLSVASESVSNNFGFIRLEKGEIFWKETSKDWNNAAIKGPYANWLVNVSFCS